MGIDKAYNIQKDWGPNVAEGPFSVGEIPKLPERKADRFTFLGFPLNSNFGLAAFPLTANSQFIELASSLGYDLLTYKSVRSIPWAGNAFPHWKYVDVPDGTDLRVHQEPLLASDTKPAKQDVSMANSFGVHSVLPAEWQADYNKAQAVLLPGQLLMLSVMPSRIEGKTLVDDAKELARLASQTKARILEVNFACPNTDGGKGLIYEDLALTASILTGMKEILGNIPVFAKVGYYKNQNDLKIFLQQTRGVLSGISSMNTYSGRVILADDTEAFPGRPTAGVSGAAIRAMAMEQARKAVRFRQELGLEKFAIIGIGGVTKPEHIQAYLHLGVDAVQTAVGAYEDPLLAQKYLQTLT